MSFLAPWALLLGAAAAVPILLHLLRRKSATRVDFPALRYLERAQKEHAAEVRLRNLALMLVRVAIVLCIALAAARPLGWLPGGGHAPTAVAIVLDSSLSTTAAGLTGTTVSRLTLAAGQVQAAARREDAVSVVPFTGAADVASALARARALLQADARRAKSLVVLTDAQGTTWRHVPVDSLRDIPATLFVVPPPAITNRAVTAVETDPSLWSPRGTVRATISATVAPDVPFGDVAWRVLLDDRSVARGALSQPGTFVARAEPTLRGWLAGRVELAPDELRGDDVRHFAVRVGDAPSIGMDGGAGRYLRGALGALAEAGRVRLRGGPYVGTADRARANTPTGLYFAPLDPLDIPAANRALQRANVPWRFGLRRTGNAPLRGDGLDGAVALQWYVLERQPGATSVDTLVRVGTAPWAVAGEGYVLVASAPDPAATNLPLTAPFVPWLDRLITERVTNDGGIRMTASPGAGYRVPAGVTSLESPDQSIQPLQAGQMATAPRLSGVHFFRRGNARTGALVVNADPAESDLAALPTDSLAATLRSVTGNARIATSVERLSRLAFAATGSRAIDVPLLYLALALLLAETLLAHRPARAAHAD